MPKLSLSKTIRFGKLLPKLLVLQVATEKIDPGAALKYIGASFKRPTLVTYT